MNLGGPILDVSVTTIPVGGSVSASGAGTTVVNVVSGGTVTAPGYDPIIITKTVSNDPTLAAQAAAAAGATSTSTTSTTSTTTVPSYVSTDRVGNSSYGIIEANGT